MKLKIIIVLIIIVALIVGYLFYQNTRYETVRISRGNMKLTVSTSGTVKAEKTANLRFGSTGRITYLPFRENDEVREGQVVASLDKNILQSSIRQAEQDFIAAKAEVEKVYDETGRKKDESFSEKVKRTAAEAKQNKAYDTLKDAEQAIKDSNLYAPFDGVVTAVNGEINEWTNAFSTQPLITVVDFSTIYFDGEISEENSNLIKVGQVAIITIDAHPGTTHEGKVNQISKQVRKNGDGENIVPVKIAFDTQDTTILLNFKGDAQVIVGEKENVLLLPKNAVEKEGKSAYVSVRDGYFIRKKPIQLGEFNGKFWEIINGLKESEEILVRK